MAREQITTAVSRNGVPIRLTEERWQHIIDARAEFVELRAEVLRTISEAERVLAGPQGEMMALRTQSDGKVLVAIYREMAQDGFVITAYRTRRLASLHRRTQIWPSPN